MTASAAGRQARPGSSSVSAPVSPSPSFANLDMLRHSLAMRSGDLSLEESAHTFPINDDLQPPPSPSSSSSVGAPVSAAPPSSSSASSSSMHRPRASSSRVTDDPERSLSPPATMARSSRPMPMAAANATSPSPPMPLPMVSPLPPLSMRDLPPPRSRPSPHADRRLSPFHDFRGTGFTPATTPPLQPESPQLGFCGPPSTTSRPSGAFPSRSRRRRSGSASQTLESESQNAWIPSARRDRPSDSGRTPVVEPLSSAQTQSSRSRSSSETGSGLHRRSRSGSSQSVASRDVASSSLQFTRPPQRRSHSGLNLSRSLGHDMRCAEESEASDTGAEGDADESPRRPWSSARQRAFRTRSSPHLPLGSPAEWYPFLNGLSSFSPILHPGLASNSDSGIPTPHPDLFSGDLTSPDGYFGMSSTGQPGSSRTSPRPQSFWHLHPAALTAGLGVAVAEAQRQQQQQATRDTELDEFLAPPPPYEAPDEASEEQRSGAASLLQLEHEQARASMGRSLAPVAPEEDEEGGFLAFSPRRRNVPSSRVDSSMAHDQSPSATSLPPSAILSTTAPGSTQTGHGNVQSSTQVVNVDVTARERPPAWQPKSDTEGETEAEQHSRDTVATNAESRCRRRISRSTAEPPAHSRRRSGRSSSPLAQQMSLESDAQGDDLPPALLRWLLHPLRMLAAVPGFVGAYWLLRNVLLHYALSQSIYTRGHLDPNQPTGTSPRRATCGLDFLLASLWALSTAYHALSLTTLLLRRWLIYYSLLPSLIRLLALQAICWPLVRLTIFVAGPDRPIEAWIVIASFTAFSDVVARWVTSNIADAPTQRSTPQSTSSRPQPSSSSSGRVSPGGSRSRARSRDRASAGVSSGTSVGRPPVSAVNEYARMPSSSSSLSFNKPRGRVKTGQRFWRAIMGAPLDSSTDSEEDDDDDDNNVEILHAQARRAGGITARGGNIATQWLRKLRGARGIDPVTRNRIGMTTELADDGSEMDAFGDGGETTDAGATTAAMNDVDGLEDDADEETAAETLRKLRLALRRRRRHRMRAKMAAISGSPLSGGTGSSGSHSAGSYVRIRSRRVFHWEVAMKRNVAPIGVLAYLTLWGLLLGGMS